MKLSTLIRKIRNCKSQTDERIIIVKECALIRAELGNKRNRARNVAKLIYIHTLGYSTHFGQVECINLMSLPTYSEKRIGYLGLLTLLDERQEVLPLIEHTLQKDLEEPHEYIKSLAITTLSNIGSEDICRDLCEHIVGILNDDNTSMYLLKKSLICAGRVFMKCPDKFELFLPCIVRNIKKVRMKEHNIGLFNVILMSVEKSKVEYRKYVNVFVKYLSKLIDTKSREYNVSGLNDPFLMIRVLDVLKWVSKGSVQVSQSITDILVKYNNALSAGKGVKNTAACAVLYAVVRCVFGSECGECRGMACDVLTKFMKARKSNNLRYIALKGLYEVMKFDKAYVKKHGDVIVDCLKSNDVSIKKRAVELIYLLVDKKNVKFLVTELIMYLQNAEGGDVRKDLARNIFRLVKKYSQSDQWKVNTLIRVLIASEKDVSVDIAAQFISIISQVSEDHQKRIVNKLYMALQKIISKPFLISKQNIMIQLCIWNIGEYGEMLDNIKNNNEIIKLVLTVMISSEINTKTLLYCLTALVKLGDRYPSEIENIQFLLGKYKKHHVYEVQQRANVFSDILSCEDDVKDFVLDKMPEIIIQQTDIESEEDDEEEIEDEKQKVEVKKEVKKEEEKPNNTDIIFGQLIDINSIPDSPSKNESSKKKKDEVDILSFFSTPLTPTPMPKSKIAQQKSLDDIFNMSTQVSTPKNNPVQNTNLPAPLVPTTPEKNFTDPEVIIAYEDNDIKIEFELKSLIKDRTILDIMAYFTNKTLTEFEKFEFRISVPSYLKRNIEKPSSEVLKPVQKRSISQRIKIKNTSNPKKRVILRFKLSYFRKDSGKKFEMVKPVKNIPMKY